MKKAEARKHEEIKQAKNLEKKVDTKEKIETVNSVLSNQNLYNAGIAKGEHADLLHF